MYKECWNHKNEFIMPIFYFWWTLALAYIQCIYVWFKCQAVARDIWTVRQSGVLVSPNTERSAHCYNRLGTLKELSHFQPDISVSVNWVGTSLYSELRFRTWILILGSCIVLMLLRLDSFLSWFIFVRWGRATKWFIGSLDQCTVSEPFTEVWSVPLYKYIQYLEKYFIAM